MVDIFTLVVNKHTFPPPITNAFALAALKNLPLVERGSGLFKFYNQYFRRASLSGTPMAGFLEAFWAEMKARVDLFLRTAQQPHVLAYLCFLISQIVSEDRQADLSGGHLNELVQLISQLPPEFQQYPLTVLFSCLYFRPTGTLAFLRQKGLLHPLLLSLPSVQIEGRIPRKIFLLAMVKMMETEEDQEVAGHLLATIVGHLKAQIASTHAQLARLAPAEVRPRKLNEEARHNYEARLLDELNDNELVNMFAKFDHPANALSEYDQFKVVFWQH